MIKIHRSDRGILVLEVGGRLDRSELEQAVTLVEISLAEQEKTHLYVEVEVFSGFDLSILPDYLPRAMVMLGQLHRFGRIAVVADQKWVRWATRMESALLPHISYEVFTTGEKADALAWVEGRRDRPHAPSLKIIDTNQPDVLGFDLDGTLTAAELKSATLYFEAALEREGRVSLLGRIRRIGGVEPSAFFDGKYLQMKLKALGKVDRYALVGGPSWLRVWAAAFNPVVSTEIRHFALEEEASAWAWLGAEPKTERALAA